MRADEHMARFEGEQALREYEDALVRDSRDGAAAAGRLRALLLLGRYRSARHALPPLLVEFPRWPDTHVVRGEIALGWRDDPVFAGILDGSSYCNADAAREAFCEALRLDPECVQAWRGLATAFRVNGQLDEAITILAKAENEIGWRPGLILEHAICARDDGRLNDALSYAHEVLASLSDHPEGRIIEIRLLTELYRPEDAMKAMDALAAIHIDSAPAHIAVADIFAIMTGRSADGDWRSVLVANQYTLIAAALRDPGYSASAIYFTVREAVNASERSEAFRYALAGAPESPALLVGLADQLDDDGDANGALDLVQRALEADPAYLPAQVVKAWALMRAGRFTDAEALATELAERYPRIIAVRNVAASAEFRQGRFETALEHDLALREIVPNAPFTFGAISEVYRGLGDIPAAEQQLRLAIEQWPGVSRLFGEQARCAAAENRQREARIARMKSTAIALSDARASGKRGAGLRLMVHNLSSWLLVRLPDWEVNSAALARVKRTSEDYKGRDRLSVVGPNRITGMLWGLDWDAARSYALADRATDWLLYLVAAAIIAAGFTAPSWAAQMAGRRPSQLAR